SVSHLRHADRAVILNLADLAAAALLQIDLGNSLADDTEVIQIRFYTVIRTSADRNLELVRQLHFPVSVIESLVDLLRQRECIDQSVLAGCSLTGYDRADFRTCTSSLKSCLHQILSQRFDIVKRYSLDFHRQTGSHGHLAASELL